MKLVKKLNGDLQPLDQQKLLKCAKKACENLEDVDYELVAEDAIGQLYDKADVNEVNKALVLSARSKIEKEPNYSYVAARLLLQNIYRQVFGHKATAVHFAEDYKTSFIKNIKQLVKEKRLHEDFNDLKIEELANALKPERDLKFKFLGLQTLFDRYFIRSGGRVMESPQGFFMRIAIGLCIGNAARNFYNNTFPNEKIIEFYNLISTFRYMPSTPTLFNSGTPKSQNSSCFLSTLEDSLDGILGTGHEQGRLSKYAGGLGVDFTNIRATGGYINGTNGESGGLIPWLKIYNSIAGAVNQGGKRKGAMAVYLEPWHYDFEEYLDLLKNTGDDRRRCHEIHTVVWMNDLFMQKVESNEDWYLFSPDEAVTLHKTFGEAFKIEYESLIKLAEKNEIKLFKKVKAKDLWKKILKSISETGHPWITYKDSSNACYMQLDQGIINNTNLCTEIFRHTIPSKWEEGEKIEVGETAVCTIGSLNYKEHITTDNEPDYIKIYDTGYLSVEMLDNAIENGYYPIKEAKKSHFSHRPIGLGTMGFQDILHAKKLPYDCKEAIDLAGKLQETVAYAATLASADLAEIRGSFKTFKTSSWARGELHQDLYNKMVGEDFVGMLQPSWEKLRKKIQKTGMRNANVLANAPTATISYIVDCKQSVEADFAVLHVYSTLSGDFTLIDEDFVKRCKAEGIWNNKLLKQIKLANGDVSGLNIPDSLKKEFQLAFDVDYHYIVDCAAVRQRWIDMGQSLNLYSNKNSMKYLNDMYFYTWKKKLKSTYYLRTEAASKVEKSTVEVKEKECSLAAKARGEICESCT